MLINNIYYFKLGKIFYSNFHNENSRRKIGKWSIKNKADLGIYNNINYGL